MRNVMRMSLISVVNQRMELKEGEARDSVF